MTLPAALEKQLREGIEKRGGLPAFVDNTKAGVLDCLISTYESDFGLSNSQRKRSVQNKARGWKKKVDDVKFLRAYIDAAKKEGIKVHRQTRKRLVELENDLEKTPAKHFPLEGDKTFSQIKSQEQKSTRSSSTTVTERPATRASSATNSNQEQGSQPTKATTVEEAKPSTSQRATRSTTSSAKTAEDPSVDKKDKEEKKVAAKVTRKAEAKVTKMSKSNKAMNEDCSELQAFLTKAFDWSRVEINEMNFERVDLNIEKFHFYLCTQRHKKLKKTYNAIKFVIENTPIEQYFDDNETNSGYKAYFFEKYPRSLFVRIPASEDGALDEDKLADVKATKKEYKLANASADEAEKLATVEMQNDQARWVKFLRWDVPAEILEEVGSDQLENIFCKDDGVEIDTFPIPVEGKGRMVMNKPLYSNRLQVEGYIAFKDTGKDYEASAKKKELSIEEKMEQRAAKKKGRSRSKSKKKKEHKRGRSKGRKN